MIIGLIGTGLIGGSFGRAVLKNTPHKVYGYDLSAKTLEKAKELNAISGELTQENACTADVFVLAVTPDNFERALDGFLPLMKNGAVVLDFCGVKRVVVKTMIDRAKKHPDIRFIGGHPMAGRELSGVENSTDNLFDNAPMIITNVNADEKTLEGIKELFLSIGFGCIEETTPEDHDRKIAYTSQLCHVVSNAFIKNETAAKHDGYSAGSYKDLTRVARLDPKMWSGLMLANVDFLEKEIKELSDNLSKYLVAIENKDRAALEELLKEGNDRKIALDEKREVK